MDFIDDDPTDGRERRKPARLAQEDAQAFGSREQNVRRREKLLLARIRRSIPGAQSDTNGRFATVDGAERALEVFFKVVTEGAQRRYVDGVNGRFQFTLGGEQGEFI